METGGGSQWPMGSPNRCAWGYKTGGTSRALRDLLLWSSLSCHPNPVTSSKSIPSSFSRDTESLHQPPAFSIEIVHNPYATWTDSEGCYLMLLFSKKLLWLLGPWILPAINVPTWQTQDGFFLPTQLFQEWGTSMAQPPFVRRLPNLPSSSNSPGRTALKGPCSRIGCTTARETWLAPSFWVFQAFQSCLSCLSVQSFFCFLRDHPHYVLTLADLTDCKNLWKKRHISRPLRTLTCSKPRKRAQRLQQEPFKGRTWW